MTDEEQVVEEIKAAIDNLPIQTQESIQIIINALYLLIEKNGDVARMALAFVWAEEAVK